jgi:hypothetical protein
MTDLWAWFAGGGYTMGALGLVATVLGFLILERFLATGAQMRALRPGGAGLCEPSPDTAAPAGLRRMGLIRACIVVAPLLGLLGTVSGMIETFDSILRGGYITEMGGGICKALLTTQYGLAIAAPGLVAERILVRRVEKLDVLRRRARLGRLPGPSPVARPRAEGR